MFTIHSAYVVLAAISACAASSLKQPIADPVSPDVSSLSTSPFFAEINHKVRSSSDKRGSKYELLKHLAGKDYVGKIVGVASDAVYATSVTIGGQSFKVVFDTGSTDLWIASKGLKCENLTDYPEPLPVCGLAAPFFDAYKSPSFKPYPGLRTFIQYGSGEVINGSVGLDTVNIAGLQVTGQRFGLVDSAAFLGDGITSGVLGLAQPGLSQLYNVSSGEKVNYSPFFFTAAQQHKVEPHFSVALDRGSATAQYNSTYDARLGYVSFGGLPPTPVTKKSATVNAQTYKIPGSNVSEYVWWTVPVDRYVFPGSNSLETKGTAIVDTGNSLIDLPTDIAAAYNRNFNPPAKYDEDSGSYSVDCHATPPPFSVVLAGVTFALNSKSLVVPVGNGSDLCVSAIQDGGLPSSTNVFNLGDPFFWDVVATFHIDTEIMTFTERVPY